MAAIPESYYSDWFQAECLISEVEPVYRALSPQGFQLIFTEHGISPFDFYGTVDDDLAMTLKAKAIVRTLLLWINKGIDRIWWFSHLDTTSSRTFGLLKKEGLASICSIALANLAAVFAASDSTTAVTALSVASVSVLGSEVDLYGNGRVSLRDVVAILPYQLSKGVYAVGLYLQSPTFPTTISPPRSVEILFNGLDFSGSSVALFEPIKGVYEQFAVRKDTSSLFVSVELDDSPRLLLINYPNVQGVPFFGGPGVKSSPVNIVLGSTVT
jgi:hypothetical protein